MKAFSKTSMNAGPSDAQKFIDNCRSRIEPALDRLVPPETSEPSSVHAAIRWSLFAGGKRLRPALVLAVGETFGAAVDDLLRTACALEMIHTYSLIHDDLPSMDDDDLRRGRPTCHVQFGEAVAILAGDALQTLAFQTIAEDDRLAAATRVVVISEIARAAGTPDGMVAGQAFDLDAESRDVQEASLERIHRHKTGALIRAAARAGAIIAGTSESDLDAITRYGGQLGLLFQITDDLLDVTSSAAILGKTPGKDARARKATYPAFYGVEATEQLANTVHQEARKAIVDLESPTKLLDDIADFILHRRG